LNEGSEAAASIPAYKPYYFNKSQSNTAPTSQKSEPPRVVSSANGFSIIKDGNKFRRIPTSKVDKYMIAHTKPEYGVQNVE
jgi:hypothetical protein